MTAAIPRPKALDFSKLKKFFKKFSEKYTLIWHLVAAGIVGICSRQYGVIYALGFLPILLHGQFRLINMFTRKHDTQEQPSYEFAFWNLIVRFERYFFCQGKAVMVMVLYLSCTVIAIGLDFAIGMLCLSLNIDASLVPYFKSFINNAWFFVFFVPMTIART